MPRLHMVAEWTRSLKWSLQACRLRMETCVADGDDDDDDDDKHRITINKSQIDTHVAAEGEKTLKDVLDGQIDKEPGMRSGIQQGHPS